MDKYGMGGGGARWITQRQPEGALEVGVWSHEPPDDG